MPVRVLSILLLLSLLPLQASAEVILRLHGSNTIGAKLGPALAEAWLKSRGYRDIHHLPTAPQQQLVVGHDRLGREVAIEIEAHGSSTGFRDLNSGITDVAMASRPIKPAEVVQLARYGQMDSHQSEFVVGLDGIAVVVNRDNPLTHIDKGTLHRIFAGEVRNWRQLGGPEGPIHVYARDDNSGTYDTFRHLVLGKTPLIAGAKRYESNADLSDDVSRDPNGIGFVGLPYVRHAKALAVADGPARPILPDAFTVATEDYALARRLFLYVPSRHAKPAARAFAEYAVSAAGQRVVDAAGFISQTILAGKVRPGPEAPSEYRELIKGARRLSLNFRFERGSVNPDTKAMRDLDRLVRYMQQGGGNRQLILMGFADSDEAIPLYSLELSVTRADTVADLLLRRGIAPTRVRGYGAAVPVASNATPAGRHKNRRVEVWVR